jgi:hypothetical protein
MLVRAQVVVLVDTPVTEAMEQTAQQVQQLQERPVAEVVVDLVQVLLKHRAVAAGLVF